MNRQRAKAQRETSILVGTRPSGGGRPEPKGVTIVAQKRRRFQNSRCSERRNAAAIRLSSRTNRCCRYSLRMYWVHNCAGTARRPAHRGCALRIGNYRKTPAVFSCAAPLFDAVCAPLLRLTHLAAAGGSWPGAESAFRSASPTSASPSSGRPLRTVRPVNTCPCCSGTPWAGSTRPGRRPASSKPPANPPNNDQARG